jgi:hypothetical protein
MSKSLGKRVEENAWSSLCSPAECFRNKGRDRLSRQLSMECSKELPNASRISDAEQYTAAFPLPAKL